MLTLFLGAGFSKWAADLPVASQLFDYNIKPWGNREKKRIEIVKRLKDTWDTLHPGGLTEQFIADALDFPENDKQSVLWYIVRRLSEPFIWEEYHAQKWRRHVLMIDENRKYDRPGVVRAQKFLTKFYNPLLAGIITTNYDIIIEYALGTKGFNYGISNEILTGRGPYPVSQWRNPVALKGTIPLAKIHGSISWDKYGHYTDGRRGITGNALIVAPAPKYKRPDPLIFAWKVAEKILVKTTRMIVFGFAFNPYDKAVLSLLKSARDNLKSVLIIDKKPCVETAKNLWPDAKIVSALPPPACDKEIDNWQKEF